MSAEMVAPAWMHTQISAEQYDSWSEEQCAGIEIVDGMVVVSPSTSKRHNRLARVPVSGLTAGRRFRGSARATHPAPSAFPRCTRPAEDEFAKAVADAGQRLAVAGAGELAGQRDGPATR